MDLIVLLSVLAITHTIVLARPADTDSRTKRSTDDSSNAEPFSPKSIKLPTEIRRGHTLIINGTINTGHTIFEVVLPAKNKSDKNNCKILFDINNETFMVSPPFTEGEGSVEYNVVEKENWKQSTVYPPFSIKLTATDHNNFYMLQISFDGYGEGPSGVLKCGIDSYDDFETIEFRQGLHNITSLLFQF